jgi:hypothetical protein
MKRIKQISIQILFVCVALTSFSITVHADWFEWNNIEVILLNDDSLDIKLVGGSSRCDRHFRLLTSEGNYDVKASALLAAYYSGHEVGLEYSGDLNTCETKVLRFRVRP